MSARGSLALALCLMAPLGARAMMAPLGARAMMAPLGAWVLMTPHGARAQEGSLAATTLGQVMKARAGLQAECGFDILKESPLGDLSCKSGTRTAVEAWDEALTKAGLPTAERAGTAERLGLVPAPEDEPAGLWRADPKDVARLIANLSLKAGG